MKTKNDFFLLLDKYFKAGKFPNGMKVSRNNTIKYFSSSDIKFQGELTHGSIGAGGIQEWYNEWYKTRIKKEGFISSEKKVINKLPEIDLLNTDFDFPEGETEHLKPYDLNKEYDKILFISDLHIPFHSLEAVKIAINHGRDIGVNCIILGGDILDMYEVSSHEKQPNKSKLVRELDLGKFFIEQLRKIFPSEKIVYKLGNHETRLERYLYKNAPAISELTALHLRELLDLKNFNVDVVENQQLMTVGKLSILHGNEFNTGGGGVNVARSLRLKALDNILFGNFHKTQTDFQKNIHGSVSGSWSIGCLCDLNPRYMPFNQWNLGFATIETFADGTFSVDNKKIIGCKVL